MAAEQGAGTGGGRQPARCGHQEYGHQGGGRHGQLAAAGLRGRGFCHWMIAEGCTHGREEAGRHGKSVAGQGLSTVQRKAGERVAEHTALKAKVGNLAWDTVA